MPTWLAILAGVACVLMALQQFRMTLIYMNILQSSVVDPLAGPQPALIHTALLDCLKFASFAVVLFITRWPHLVTYLLLVLLVKSVVDFVLALFQLGRFGIVRLTRKRRAYTAAETVPCIFYIIAAAISYHFLGF